MPSRNMWASSMNGARSNMHEPVIRSQAGRVKGRPLQTAVNLILCRRIDVRLIYNLNQE